jgi:hypothetical protein
MLITPLLLLCYAQRLLKGPAARTRQQMSETYRDVWRLCGPFRCISKHYVQRMPASGRLQSCYVRSEHNSSRDAGGEGTPTEPHRSGLWHRCTH